MGREQSTPGWRLWGLLTPCQSSCPLLLYSTEAVKDSKRKMQAEIDKAESSFTMPMCSHYVCGYFKFMLLLSTY